MSAKKKADEYSAFAGLLRTVASVPHSEIKVKLEAEKKNRKPKKKVSGHVSSGKD